MFTIATDQLHSMCPYSDCTIAHPEFHRYLRGTRLGANEVAYRTPRPLIRRLCKEPYQSRIRQSVFLDNTGTVISAVYASTYSSCAGKGQRRVLLVKKVADLDSVEALSWFKRQKPMGAKSMTNSTGGLMRWLCLGWKMCSPRSVATALAMQLSLGYALPKKAVGKPESYFLLSGWGTR